ncbi:tetratricopeptide repeat protein [Micromonospora sp. L32]|uniref:tetratricopeptide repeat protein n=1 Tax=Micromonospora sp. L32 TaxID=3452214 RepID=UPI003F8A66DE
MRRPSWITLTLLPVIALVLLPAMTNVATGALPSSWDPYLWLAWPLAGLLAVPVVLTEVRRGRSVKVSGDRLGGVGSSLGGVVWNIPAAVRTFVGRSVELRELAQTLSGRNGGAVALVGPPGVGKTQLAEAYAIMERGQFELGWWLVADDRLTVVASLAQLADRLGVGDTDQEVAARRVVQELSGQSRWLLVFDNVGGESDLAGLVPSGRGQVVITSRDPGLARVARVSVVRPFEEEESARFLQDRTGDRDDDAARWLAREMGGLPLALEQAAAYCVQTGVSLAGYVQRYRAGNQAWLWRQESPVDRPPVSRTFELAFAAAAKRSKAAVQLLTLSAFFAPATGIPRDVFVSGAAVLPSALAAAAADPIKLDATIAVLLRMSLIEADGDVLRLHPLVQDVLRSRIAEARRARLAVRIAPSWLPLPGRDRTAGWPRSRWIALAATAISEALPADTADPSGWDRWVALLPHAAAVLGHAGQDNAASTSTTDLGVRLGVYLLERGEYGPSRRWLERAAAERRRVLGEEHPMTLTSMNNLAIVVSRMGELAEARRLHEQVLQQRRRVLGEEHPTTVISMGNLAAVLSDMGELAEARRLHEQVLQQHRRVLGGEHPTTLTSMNNLALVLRRMGQLAEARRLHEQALQLRRLVLGEEHPTTLTSMGNLATVLSDMGELAEARRLHEQVLQQHRRVLGEEHPTTVISMGNLAAVLSDMGELAEARRLHEHELEVCTRVLGEEHPSTLTSISNLALVLSDMGELAEARRLHEHELEVCTRVLGEEHPSTLTSMNNLALVLRRMGELAEARRLHEQTLQQHRRVLGEEHPATLISMGNLATVLSDMGELAEARRLHEQVLQLRRLVLGEEHPATLTSMGNLAAVLRRMGELAEARRLHEQVLQLRRLVLGEEHPATLTSMGNLATVLSDMGELAEARRLHEQVLQQHRRVLGEEHPTTLSANQRLAEIAAQIEKESGGPDRGP